MPATVKSVTRLYILTVISLAVTPDKLTNKRLFDKGNSKFDLRSYVQQHVGVMYVRHQCHWFVNHCSVVLGEWLSKFALCPALKENLSWTPAGSAIYAWMTSYQRKVLHHICCNDSLIINKYIWGLFVLILLKLCAL